MPIDLLCPVTSRGCDPDPAQQPLFHALLPSLQPFAQDVTLHIGYDGDDPVWSKRAARELVRGVQVAWHELHALSKNITAIYNWLAREARGEYLLPANDDLQFETSPLPAVGTLVERRNFGTVAFQDHAFPGLPTFYIAHRTHLDIFGVLYPLPWTGAHQDSWIHDVYKPWLASEIDPRIVCRNHVGAGTRFEYGGLDGYADAVMRGRRKVNEWVARTGARPALSDDALAAVPMVI